MCQPHLHWCARACNLHRTYETSQICFRLMLLLLFLFVPGIEYKMAFGNTSGCYLKAREKHTLLCPVEYSATLRYLFRSFTVRVIRLACDRCIYINDTTGNNVTGKLLVLCFMFRESRIRFSAPTAPILARILNLPISLLTN